MLLNYFCVVSFNITNSKIKSSSLYKKIVVSDLVYLHKNNISLMYISVSETNPIIFEGISF
jgi:hypothetical protein